MTTEFTPSKLPGNVVILDEEIGAGMAQDLTRRRVLTSGTGLLAGFGLAANSHPNAWTSTQAPLRRDFVKDYVAAVRAAGLKVGLYYSPINWRYPGYYNVNGDKLASPPWNYEGSDPASFDYVANARTMKEEVYQAVKQLVTDYGAIDELWWDGGWLAEKGSDADGAYFWESGLLRDASNRWNVDAYGETDASGR
ncbi:alpha-L-fucosidase, partial [Kibdelosporangium lantanae]